MVTETRLTNVGTATRMATYTRECWYNERGANEKSRGRYERGKLLRIEEG